MWLYFHEKKKNQALEYLGKSKGIQRTRELAIEHANLAAAAIGSLPETDDEDVKRSRRALIDLTHRVISRNKWAAKRFSLYTKNIFITWWGGFKISFHSICRILFLSNSVLRNNLLEKLWFLILNKIADGKKEIVKPFESSLLNVLNHLSKLNCW